MTDIVSVSNPRVKRAVRLKESRARRKEKLFPVDGIREILRAWQSGFELEEVFILADGSEEIARRDARFDAATLFLRCYADRIRSFADMRLQDGGTLPALGTQLLKLLSKHGVPIWTVSPSVFDKLSFGERGEGIVALVRSRTDTFSTLERKLSDNPLLGVIEGVEKPGNVGAVFRSADGAGLDAMIVACPGTDLFNPNTIRASLGTVFRLPTVIASTEETLEWLSARRIQAVAALCDGAVDYTAVDYTGPTAIALGSEAEGLSPCWAQPEFMEHGRPAKLPMLGIADSLNISAAAAVLFYEARRQRGEVGRSVSERD